MTQRWVKHRTNCNITMALSYLCKFWTGHGLPAEAPYDGNLRRKGNLSVWLGRTHIGLVIVPVAAT
jgi:hypothetical protein